MQRRFSVRSLGLFGSRVRERPHPESDFDVLVEFDGPATSARYFGPAVLSRGPAGWVAWSILSPSRPCAPNFGDSSNAI